MKDVTDFQYFGGGKATAASPDEDPARVTSPDGKSPDEGVTSKLTKKSTPAAAGKKTPAAAVGTGGGGETPSNQPFPEADPADPNKNKVTPDCAFLDMS